MLQPRETDLPFLFFVLVVLPLVAYILLGKWNKVSKKKEKISEVAQIVDAEEAFRVEAMTAASVIPFVPILKSNNGVHKCERCFGSAKTRCSRCKSVRYCSGKCQIIHWRQVHKQECQLLEYNGSCASPNSTLYEESSDEQLFFGEKLDSQFLESNLNKEMSRKEGGLMLDSCGETCSTSYDNNVSSKGTFISYKPKSSQNGTNSLDIETDLVDGWSLPKGEVSMDYETYGGKCSERSQAKKSNTLKLTSHPAGRKMHKSENSIVKMSRDQTCSERGSMDQVPNALDESKLRDVNPPNGGSNIVNKGFMKIIGLKRSSKYDRVGCAEVNSDRNKNIKMLFPYEEFVKLFRYEAFCLLPRGLVNCGNSCYANAVLQCLTSTKPLTIYLLRRSHSKSCCAKSWCLICELENHVLMLRDSGEPLSLSRILSRMRSVNDKMGDGSQEDAHEFLRLLVTSMQYICLEGLGGEDVVDPRLQETTFIQHTFGGKLRSKVKCLRCHNESYRYENIMDLTLEIYGWVESLEDALTQFTSPEDLDGENMYRCGRCAPYVLAQKQLAIKEAPNILTIVLKRFQEGNYGKINKCISFPDMLDMIPFMTGTEDIPPLYMLYGVVVHLDTMNASFSGHYISYIKDLQGNWFRIDDTQVQPVSLSQVMSEGAYILFYTRSFPRPLRTFSAKPKASGIEKHRMPKAPKSTSGYKTNDFQVGSNQNRPPSCADFSDATSSEWSIFTSSDDASFTTESTRDSVSTMDYTDHDSISSILNSIYTTTDYTVSCSRSSRSKPHLITKSYQGGEPPYRLQKVCSSDSSRTSGHCTI